MKIQQSKSSPDSEPYPGGKEREARFLGENYPNPTKINFKVERAGIRLLVDVVIGHYLLHSSWKDEAGLQ